MPAEASASRFRWKLDQNGNWNDPSKWVNVDDDPDGYPREPSDLVTFATLGSDSRFITIPQNVTVSVGGILVLTSQNYFIQHEGTNANTTRLIFDTGTADDAQIFKASSGLFSISVRTRLESSLTIDVGPEGHVSLGGSIGDSLSGPRLLKKRNEGRLTLLGPNTYTGTTTVEAGQLELNASNNQPTVTGNLTIGTAAGVQAAVVVLQPNQIASPRVEVKKDGLLLFRASDQLGQLVVDDGEVISRDGAEARLASLAMTGGILEALNGGRFELDGDVTAKATFERSAIMKGDANANSAINLLGMPRTFRIEESQRIGLVVSLSLIGFGTGGVIKTGPGTLKFEGPYPNSYPGATVVNEGRLELARTNMTVGGLLSVGGGSTSATIRLSTTNTIADNTVVTVGANGTFSLANNVFDRFAGLSLNPGGLVVIGSGIESILMVTNVAMRAGEIIVANQSRLLMNTLTVSPSLLPARISGTGAVSLEGTDLAIVANGETDATVLRVDATIKSTGAARLFKRGTGAVWFDGENTYTGETVVENGTLFVTGQQPASPITLVKGTLAGTGIVGKLTSIDGTIAPGPGAGRLATRDVALAPTTTFGVELSGPSAGSGYDQLVVTGTVSLANARLAIVASFTPPPDASITLIQNDGSDPVIGTFADLPEGHKLSFEDVELTLSYRGGDGNDVVLRSSDTAITYSYFLAEGATGAFFDDDVVIANPNGTEAKMTLTFLKEGGSTVTWEQTIAAQTRTTVHVDGIEGLEEVSASVKVDSDQPLIVERTMFWDASYYGGHTANAVARPETRWIFAEGFQGFFDTYILIANANASATTATLTFLREGDTPFVTSVEIAPIARKTVYAGDYPEVAGRAFGVVVEAPQAVIAERAMYFATSPQRQWTGGHANTGITAPSTSWFHAEGATGGFFTTFILLSNPQDSDARVQVRFLLDDGTVITKEKTLAARQRLTINPAQEDPRLEQAALSTVIESDVPIVSERSMYWGEGQVDFGEGHNSAGVASTATRWGLAEGRIGGPQKFDTFILLANPSSSAADVTITYLRESGEPIVRSYTVPPTSRFNVDVKSVVPELVESTFGAHIEVKNDVPIAVERSLYWNANGVFWAGGSNALGTPLQGAPLQDAPVQGAPVQGAPKTAAPMKGAQLQSAPISR